MPRRFVAALLIIGLALPFSGGAAPADSAGWYNSAWKYRQKITVNHELVAGPVDGFPMLVNVTGSVFEHAQEDGDDILFTAADGTTKLLHEIESMNGEVVAWVQMPHLSEKEDTELYVDYGNPTAENQQQGTNVR
jgi:MSHA biogenesis protein MshQ